MKRVRIAGAGPAGLTAAIVLARAGRAVEVHERSDRLGQRFRGDLHGVDNWSPEGDITDALARWGIERSFLFEPVETLRLTTGRRLSAVRSPQPLVYLVSRGDVTAGLERGLAEQAQDLGVSLHLGSPLDAKGADIIATGADPRHRFCVEVGIRFDTRTEDLAVGLIHPEAAQGGYAYLLIHGGRGCLSVVLFGGFDRAKQQLARARALLGASLDLDIRNPEPIGGFGSFQLHPDLGSHAQPRVGEAAGLQDFVWGFGIRRAMASGALAAQCILEGSDYVAAARHSLAPLHRVGVINRCLWETTAYRGFDAYVRAITRANRPLGPLRTAHTPGRIHRWLLPLACVVLSPHYAHLFGRPG